MSTLTDRFFIGLALVLVSVSVPTSGAARVSDLLHSPLVPQGYPYAAEVRVEISGQVALATHDSVTTYNVCDDQSHTFASDEHIAIRWYMNYSHVTVPVADAQDLGAAYKRLHVPLTPTSEPEQVAPGSYDISGSGPTEVDKCDNAEYSQKAKLRFTGRPGFSGAAVFLFTMPSVISAIPAAYTDSLGNQTDFDAASKLSDIPTSAPALASFADWNAVGVAYAPEFKTLRTHAVVQLKPITRSGTEIENCKSHSSNGVSSEVCSANYSITYHVTLVRHFLYLTKHEYLR